MAAPRSTTASTYELTRFAVLRLLASRLPGGLRVARVPARPAPRVARPLPIPQFLAFDHGRIGAQAYWRVPTLFWLGASDGALHVACYAGLALSVAVLLGATNALVQLALWALYMSFVHVGQIFYGYGWEIQLLETGFLAVFLCPRREPASLPCARRRRGSSSGFCAGWSSA